MKSIDVTVAQTDCRRFRLRCFTLIELLVVIAIIACYPRWVVQKRRPRV